MDEGTQSLFSKPLMVFYWGRSDRLGTVLSPERQFLRKSERSPIS